MPHDDFAVTPHAAGVLAGSPGLRPLWLQAPLNVGYVLLATPLGLAYLLLLVLGLAIELPRLVLRQLLGLLVGAARLLLWLLRFGVRFVWVALIAGAVWAVEHVWWLFLTLVVGVLRIGVTLLVDLLHPRTAWQRALASARADRERARWPLASAAGRGASSVPLRDRVERLLELVVGRLRRTRTSGVMAHWIVVPAIWRRLALWERRHSMRWLDLDLPPLEPPGMTPADRAARGGLPGASLGYLLAQAPLGIGALLMCALCAALGASLLDRGNVPGALATALAALYALYLLGSGAGRFALRALAPSAATRRLYAAEAVAMQERAKADRAEQRRRDLIINASHELRTPTASIRGHVESVLLALDSADGAIEPATLRGYLEIVEREAERLTVLVDELLTAASAERAELKVVLQPVDAATVVDEVCAALAPLARREREVMLIQDVLPDLPPVIADRQRLSQVLLNLVRNAISYTPAGGIVSIGLRRAHGGRLCLFVADTGSGIAPADLERIFERFYRADASRARESGGFGLGLAIARDLVEAMGGTISAESVLGEGSCFSVLLPLAAWDGA